MRVQNREQLIRILDAHRVEERRQHALLRLAKLSHLIVVADPAFVSDVVLRRVAEDIDRRRVKEYGVGAQILLDLGVKDMILLTDTPEKKVVALDGYGLNIVGTHAIRGRKESGMTS